MPSAGGPPSQCFSSRDDNHAMTQNTWQLSAALGTFRSTLRFDNDREVDVHMTTVSLAGNRLVKDRWTVRGGLGMVVDGKLKTGIYGTHEVQPGAMLAVGAEYLAVKGDGYRPFIDVSAAFSTSLMQTVHPLTDDQTRYWASDLRFGVRSLWNVNNTLYPFAAVSVFGGPVSWKMNGQDVIGSDVHHYQVAVGGSVQIEAIGVYVEWAGLGERGLSAGLSLLW
ncbi:MAG: hypothetical protein GF313_06440 [Caldithrix sp.]|nr:hypothetical protein [Caldithrix sp.]